MALHYVSDVADLPAGTRRLITIDKREIGVFNVEGRFYALRNQCPHRGAPICRGAVTGTMRPTEAREFDWIREGEILRCPWHRWEFELASGCALHDEKFRVRTYPTVIDGEQLFVVL